VRLFKFLAAGAVDEPLGRRWPVPGDAQPGAWVEQHASGMFVYCASDLPYWLHDELWEVDVAGEPADVGDCLVVPRARLSRRIELWQPEMARRFDLACVQHASELLAQAEPAARELAAGYLEDAEYCAEEGEVRFASFSAAVAVGTLAAPADAAHAYRRERAWQAAWLERHVITSF
jgi:hypothetical protein